MSIFNTSEGQKSIWYNHNLMPASKSYNMILPLKIDKSIDIKALSLTLEEFVRINPTLRTQFYLDNDELKQRIIDHNFLNFEDNSSDQLNTDDVEEVINQSYDYNYDLKNGLPHNFRFFRLEKGFSLLILGFHHIVCDLFSIQKMIKDIYRIYHSFLINDYDPIEVDYSFFNQVDVDRANRDSLKNQLIKDFWVKELKGEYVKFTPPKSTYEKNDRCSNHIQSVVPEEIFQSVAEIASNSKTTKFIVFLTAFRAMLGKLGHSKGVRIVIPFSGRTKITKESIGYFVKPQVYDCDFELDHSFVDHLELTHHKISHLKLNIGTPLSFLDSSEGIPQFMFVYNKSPVFPNLGTATNGFSGVPFDYQDWNIQCMAFDKTESDFPFVLTLIEDTTNDIKLSFEFSKKYDSEVMGDLVTLYFLTLKELLSHNNTPLYQLNIVNNSLRKKVLKLASRRKLDYEFEGFIPEVIHQQAITNPEFIALSFNDKTLTYAELEEKSNRFANLLELKGCIKGSNVGLQIDRSLELFISVVGILKHGSAYVPIDPDFPDKRKRDIIEDGNIKFIASRKGIEEKLLDQVTTIFVEDSENDYLSANYPITKIEGTDTAYIIFTSGTTGKPKGVMVSHSAILNRIKWMQEYTPINNLDRVCHKTPITFDVSVWELFWPLMEGASIEIAKPGGHKDPFYLEELISENNVTTIHFVPSMLQLFIDAVSPIVTNSLKQVFASGEALAWETSQQFNSKFHNTKLHNLYGPTEAAVDVTFWDCSEEHPNKIIPIGYPISNISIYVVDKYMKLLPIGFPGELLIGGIGVAKGYINQPELTADKFIKNNITEDESEAILYRTGDLCRFLPNGEIEYLGRIDHQVKLRGQRIELSEIEFHASTYSGINQVLVMIQKHSIKGDLLICYYRSKEQYDSQLLEAHLRARLPDYMIPDSFVFVREFPLTANGKIDRKEISQNLEKQELIPIKRPESVQEPIVITTQKPSFDLNQKLSSYWKNILGVNNIEPNSNFFDLGGNSLLLIRLYSQIKKNAEKGVELKQLYDNPTFGEQLKVFSQLALTSPSVKTSGLDRKSNRMSSIQQGMWFQFCLDAFDRSNNITADISLNGNIDHQKLDKLLVFLVNRHDQLRAKFTFDGQDGYYNIGTCVDSVLVFLDLQDEPDKLFEVRDSISNKNYDLENDDLYQFFLCKTGIDQYYLLFGFHHIVTDGWSIDCFFSELSDLYLEKVCESNLPELSEYSDYTNWESAHNSFDSMEYWKEYLDDAPSCLDYPGQIFNDNISNMGDIVKVKISDSLSKKIMALSAEINASHFEIFLTAFYLSIESMTGKDDVVIGIPVALRAAIEIDDVFGCMIKTLPYRLKNIKPEGFQELLKRVRDINIDNLTHMETPFSNIIEQSEVATNDNRTPLFQNAFSYVENQLPINFLGIENLTFDFTTSASKFEKTLYINKIGDDFHCAIEYQKDRFDKDNIENHLETFVEVLEAIITDLSHYNSELYDEKAEDIQNSQYAEKVVTFCKEFFSISEINRDSNLRNYFRNSMMVIKFQHALNKAFDCKIKLSTIYELDNMHALLMILEEARLTKKKQAKLIEGNIKKLVASKYQDVLFCMSSEGQMINIPLILEIELAYDPTIICDALTDIINLHEIFKAKFSFVKGNLKVSLRERSWDINLKNINSIDISSDEDFIQRPFKQNEALFRFRLKEDHDKTLLTCVFSHLIMDAESLSIFCTELEKSMNNEPLDTAVSFFDYALEEHKSISNHTFDDGIYYWSDKLSRIEHPEFSFQNYTKGVGKANYISEFLGKEEFKKLQDFCSQQRISPFIFLSAILATVLSNFESLDIVHLPFVASTRLNHRFKNTIGPFLNTLNMSLEINEEVSFEVFLKEVRSEIFNCLTHSEVPIEMSISNLDESQKETVVILFKSMLVNYIIEGNKDELAGIKPITYKNTSCKQDLKFTFVETIDNLFFEFQFSDEVDADTIKDMFRVMKESICYRCDYPERPIRASIQKNPLC